MAGMFYSLEEVAEKLNITEDQVKQIVQQGKLREFRDGPNLLFKVDEVESLITDAAARVQASEPENIPAEQAGEPEILLTDSSAEGSIFESDLTSADTSITSEGVNVLGGTESDFEVSQDTSADTAAVDFDAGSAIEAEDLSLASSSEEGLLLEHTSLPESQEEKSLSSFGDESLPSLGGESLSSLGDESLSSSGSESPIKEVDDDVNLDSFGSGSGLLDLSLQADDTSLGGILDEIYTPDSGQRAEKPLAEASSEMNAEADQILGEEGLEAPVMADIVSPIASRTAYVESAPDSVSSAFGYMMFLPLLAIIYTGIVGIAGYRGVRPVILEKVQGIIWYVMAGTAVLAMLMIAVPAMLAGKSSQTEKKKKEAPKPKKPEKPKKLKKQKK